MTSIRRFLITSLLAIIVLTIFVSILQGYQTSSKEIQQQMDAQLIDLTKLLSDSLATKSKFNHDIQSGNKFAYQMITSEQIHLMEKNQDSLSAQALIAPLKQAFSEVNFEGYRWRAYAFFNEQKNVWVIVAERLDLRFDLAEKIILKSLMPIVFAIPLAAILIWFVIGHAVKPLRQLSHALKNKRDNDLSVLGMNKHTYQEIDQVVQSTNSLLKRLALSFERETHFASDVAHELRTPLSVLKIDLHNLAQQLGSGNQRIQPLTHSVDRMEHLIQQILTLYRTTPDQFMATFKVFDLYAMSQKVIAEHYAMFEKKSQSIELQGESCLLEGDQAALEVLLLNLLENANKYSQAGAKIVVLVAEQKHRKEQDDSIILQVEDSGPGINASQYERIFDRFYRVDGDQHSSNEQGCGLGLSIVKHIVELHKAEITLSPSTFKTGLQVRVELPKDSKGKTHV